MRLKVLSMPLFFVSSVLSVVISFFSANAFGQGVSDDQRLRIDIGASTGNRNGTNYTEANVGINLLVTKGVIWRNALWGRFQSEVKEAYGIDTSVRGQLDLGDYKNGASLFVAPGYRFTTESSVDPAPFGEAGLTLRAGGISIGGGIKTIFNEWVKNGIENDTQYFVTLGGGLGI